MKQKIRIYADFNKLDEKRRAILTCRGTIRDLEALGVSLHDGMELTLYMPDDFDDDGKSDFLEVEAVAQYNNGLECWVGAFDWDSLGYVSKKKK